MPNITCFKTKKDYLKWYRDYRKKNHEKLNKTAREWIRENRRKNGIKKITPELMKNRIEINRYIKKVPDGYRILDNMSRNYGLFNTLKEAQDRLTELRLKSG